MSNKVKYSIIISCTLFLISLFVYSRFFSSPSTYQRSQDFINDSYNGTVQNKYYDQKDPNNITLTIRKDGKPLNLILPKDTSFFGFIKIGDSLVKTKGEDFIEVHKSSMTTNFKINFDLERGK